MHRPIIVFLGPTLDRVTARGLLAADYRPPAQAGDVLVALLERPRVIGLIDGYLHAVPACWHKELLLALELGVRVLGAASMGALRAAELAPFGMEGVGAIHAAVARGEIEADDAVAVRHGPAELGYPPLSEALVDIEATLRAAAAAGVVPASLALELAALARALFYSERRYDRLLAEARAKGLPAATLDAFAAWLPAGRVAQKRADAMALLRRVAEIGDAPAPAARVRAERTATLHALATRLGIGLPR